MPGAQRTSAVWVVRKLDSGNTSRHFTNPGSHVPLSMSTRTGSGPRIEMTKLDQQRAAVNQMTVHARSPGGS